MFCLLTDSHLERAVFFGTLSWSQDQLLLQNDSATETRGLWIFQESLRPRRWTPTTCNNETPHHWLPIENGVFWPVMCHSVRVRTCQGHSEEVQLSPAKLLRSLLDALPFHWLTELTLPQGKLTERRIWNDYFLSLHYFSNVLFSAVFLLSK